MCKSDSILNLFLDKFYVKYEIITAPEEKSSSFNFIL